jgi:hypothetical protein
VSEYFVAGRGEVKLTLVGSSEALLRHKSACIAVWRDIYTIQNSVNVGSGSLWVMKHRCCASDVFRHLMEDTVVCILAQVLNSYFEALTYSNFPSPTSPSE